jgi:hypothetical protein
MNGGKGTHKLLMGKPEGKRPLGRPIRGWIIIRWLLKRQHVMVWTGLVWLRTGKSGELL